jgi:ABC-2 type transport system permease protein
MKNSSFSQLRIFWALLYRDIKVYNERIISRMLDAAVWAATLVIIAHYFLPMFGVESKFGVFVMIGNIATWGIYDMITQVAILASDILGPRDISYFLTLPINQKWILVKIALANAYKVVVGSLPLLPVGMLVTGSWDLLYTGYWFLFLFMYLLTALFYGALSLWLMSITYNMNFLTTLRARIVFPVIFFGCYQYTWLMLYKASPALGYIQLLNPITYIMEGLRSNLISNMQFMPLSICIVVLVIAGLLVGSIGINTLKKRLDLL